MDTYRRRCVVFVYFSIVSGSNNTRRVCVFAVLSLKILELCSSDWPAVHDADEARSCFGSSEYIYRHHNSQIRFAKYVNRAAAKRRTLLSELDRRFLISNAQLANKPIIYCNDGFCDLTGYSRSDIIQKPCTCEFLYGDETSDKSIKADSSRLARQ